MENKKIEEILKIKTKEGYAFKILLELLQDIIREGCFIFDEKGIHLNGGDGVHKKRPVTMIDMELFKKKFSLFKYQSLNNSPNNLSLGINMIHFYKMLK